MREKSLQMKFYAILNRIALNFSKPKSQFLREMFLGSLRSSHIHASKIGCHIQDKISLKKNP
ncbi:MAG: hypothetical protein Kow0042_24490 [Calditrichia bacterium]